MARPHDADPNEDFECCYCGKDVNENRDPGGYYLYCSEECNINHAEEILNEKR